MHSTATGTVPEHETNPASGSHSSANSYTPLEIIGQGSFGVVLRAKNSETGEDVAIKRVLYDRRLHNRELQMMRDVLADARVPKDSEKDSDTSLPDTNSTSAAQSPHTPVLARSQNSLSGSLPLGSRSTQRVKGAPVILLRRHPNVAHLRNYYFTTDPLTGDRFLHLVMSYLPTDTQRLKHNYFKECTSDKEERKFTTEGANVSHGSHEEDQNSDSTLFPLLFAKAVLFQVCRALAFLHSRNVVHRDVKPANILVDPQSARVQLCDYGSAKQIINRNQERNVSYICSRYYRAPELLCGALHYGSEVDMWSFGCIAAEFMRSGGKPLFKGSTTVDQMAEIFKVLGAPSDAEMVAMNPQSAAAMRLTHKDQFPQAYRGQPMDRAHPNSLGEESESHATDEGYVRDGKTTLGDFAAEGTQRMATSATPPPTLNSDYYRCYDVLRVEAMQWRRVLHRGVPDEAVDFVAKLLCYVPEKRMPALTALAHPFFDELFSEEILEESGLSTDGEPVTKQAFSLPRLPNGRTLPVEMFMLTEAEAQMLPTELQQKFNLEVQRISSVTAAAAAASTSPSPRPQSF